MAFARLYGGTKRAFLRLGYGFTRSRNGAAAMHAASCLPVVTGAWQHQGGGALYNFGELYHWDKTMIEGLDARDPLRPPARPVAASARSWPASPTPWPAAARSTRC